jgi:hypothetical protein
MRDVVDKLKPRYRTWWNCATTRSTATRRSPTSSTCRLGTVKAQLFRAREFLLNLMETTRTIFDATSGPMDTS